MAFDPDPASTNSAARFAGAGGGAMHRSSLQRRCGLRLQGRRPAQVALRGSRHAARRPFHRRRPRSPALLNTLDVALIGVPMDLGVTNRAGARLGPRAVRAIDRIGPYEHVLRVAPMGTPRGGRRRRRADAEPLRPCGECHADIESLLSHGGGAAAPCRSRSGATIRSRARSSRDSRLTRAGGHGPYRRPLRHRRPL